MELIDIPDLLLMALCPQVFSQGPEVFYLLQHCEKDTTSLGFRV
jgi:hypothetical protein